jgi:hypothetical protein
MDMILELLIRRVAIKPKWARQLAKPGTDGLLQLSMSEPLAHWLVRLSFTYLVRLLCHLAEQVHAPQFNCDFSHSLCYDTVLFQSLCVPFAQAIL